MKTKLVTSKCSKCGAAVWGRVIPGLVPFLQDAEEAICHTCFAPSKWLRSNGSATLHKTKAVLNVA